MDNIMTDNHNIEVVLFDFGGVIAEEGFKQGLAVIAKANGLDENAFVQAAFNAVYASGYVLGQSPEKAFWALLKEKTGLIGDDVDLGAEIFSRFVLRDWMIATVRKLKANHISVGILSDQTDMLERLNEQFDFFRWFDHIFNSYNLGKGKRDSSLFDDIARLLNTEADKILFIDDDPGHVDRARQRGWKAILYIDRGSFEKDLKAMVPLPGL